MNSMQMHRFRSSVVWLIPPADRASLHGAIAAESESATTGTKFDIAATDQIRPIVTTTAIPIAAILASICIRSTPALSLPIGGPSRCEVVHRCPKFLKQS